MVAVTSAAELSEARRARLSALGSKYAVLFALVALWAVAALWVPKFFAIPTLRNTLLRSSIIGIVSLGQFLVLMVRGVDLSVPAVIAFTAVLVAERGPGLGRGLLVALGIAVAVGLFNGFFVVSRRVPAFVATFGMFVTVEGVRLAYTKGSASGNVPDSITRIGRANFLGVPYAFYVWVALLVTAAVFLYRTVTGRRMVMSGANPDMATLSGIDARRVVVGAFVACAVLAAVAGVFLAGSTGYVDRFIGQGSDLDSVTIVLLGGARFSGGEGSLVAVAAGCALLSSLFTMIVLLGWRPELQLVVKGLVLIGALTLQSSLRSRPR